MLNGGTTGSLDLVRGRVSKTVRRREHEPPDEGGDDVMHEGERSTPFSFKDAVLNFGSTIPSHDDEWESDDIDFQKDDVKKFVEDGVPTIDFSEWVYGLIHVSITKTLVVKLFGRKISYIALWNKVCAFWKPSRWF